MFPNVLFCCSFCCCVFGLVLAFSDLLLCFWSVCVLHLQTTETPPYLSWVFPVGCTWMNLIVCSFSPLISTHLVNWACWIRSRGQKECSLIGCSAEQMSANQKLIRANRTNKNCQENTFLKYCSSAGWYGGTAGSVKVRSRALVTVCAESHMFLWILQFPSASPKYSSKWTGDSQLP